MNQSLRYPRVWLRLQDCEGSSVSSWHNAHLVTAQYLRGRATCLKSMVHLSQYASACLTVAMDLRNL